MAFVETTADMISLQNHVRTTLCSNKDFIVHMYIMTFKEIYMILMLEVMKLVCTD